MQVRATVLAITTLWLAVPVRAQEPAAAPAPQDVRLLDAVPNYAEILVHQWSAGVPQDVIDAERSVDQYGRLLATKPVQATSLTDCIVLAVQNNTDLQISRLGPVSAATQVRSARAIFDPVLFGDVLRDRATTPVGSISPFSLGGGSTSSFTQHTNWDAGLRKTLLSGGQLSLSWTNSRLVTTKSVINLLVPQYTTTLGLSLNQPLLRDFGWQHALLMVEVAQNTEQQVYHQYEATIAAVVTQVEQAYWSLVLAIQSVEVQENGLALATELLRQNQGKFNVGAMPQTAVLEAKVNVASREALLIQARNARDIARDNLRAIINFRKPDAPGLLMIDPQDKPTVVPYDINIERSLRTALEQRPELIAARLNVHGKGLLRKSAENQLLPKLNFIGGIGLNGLSGSSAGTLDIPNPTPGAPPTALAASNPSLVGGYGSALDLLPDGRYYSYSAGATIEIPLDNAQAKAGYAQANITLEQSRLGLQKLQESVTLEITTAVSNLGTDLKSIDATHIARELAEENLRNQKARYDVGLATTKDLLDYSDRLTAVRFAEVQALTRYNSDLAELRRVDGTLLSARNILIERVTPEKAPWWASF